MFVTWLLFAFIGYIASDASYQECLQSNGLLLLMLVFGWLPALIVTTEYYELQESKEYQSELKLAEENRKAYEMLNKGVTTY